MPLDALIERTAALFAAMSNPTRLAVLCALADAGELTAGELQGHVALEQSALSHHLRTLREARLVDSQRRGRHRVYRLHDAHVAHIVGDALRHVGEDLDRP